MTIKEFEEKVMEILRSPMWGTNDEATKWKTHEIMKLAKEGVEEPETERHCPASPLHQKKGRKDEGTN